MNWIGVIKLLGVVLSAVFVALLATNVLVNIIFLLSELILKFLNKLAPSTSSMDSIFEKITDASEDQTYHKCKASRSIEKDDKKDNRVNNIHKFRRLCEVFGNNIYIQDFNYQGNRAYRYANFINITPRIFRIVNVIPFFISRHNYKYKSHK